jgi:hypothetical protein
MGGGRLGRARRALAARSRKEKATGLAVLALALAAPFGGLTGVADEPPKPVTVNRPFTIGPFTVTFLRAYRLSQFVGSQVEAWETSPVKPTVDSRRILVIDVDVVNGGKRPEFANVLTKAVSIRGAAKVDGYGGPTAQPELVYRADGSSSGALNPGLTHRLALIVEQPATATGSGVTVSVARMSYIGKGGGVSNLDEDYWLQLDDVARRGTIPVGERPPARAAWRQAP